MKRTLFPFFLIFFFFVMLCCPRETFDGASDGLLLWFQIVLPTLFPFLIITNLLIHTNAIFYFAGILRPVIGRFFHTSANGTFAVLCGFLCGYPVGAKVTADLVRSGRISRAEGAYLLSFCNNTSPMFLMNYIVLRHLKRGDLLLPALALSFLSPVLCSFLFRFFYLRKQPFGAYAAEETDAPHPKFDFSILDTTIMNGFETITKVGGYIILFSVLLRLLGELPFHSAVWTSGILPSLEITNGIAMTASSALPFRQKFIISMALSSFGGVCSIAQTQCMIQGTGLKTAPYIIEKLVTAIVTSLLAFLCLQL